MQVHLFNHLKHVIYIYIIIEMLILRIKYSSYGNIRKI